MTHDKSIAIAVLLAALVPTAAFAQETAPNDKTAPQTENRVGPDRDDGGKYVGNSGRLAPNSGVERKPTAADKTEHSADDPSLNAGIYATPHGKRQ